MAATEKLSIILCPIQLNNDDIITLNIGGRIYSTKRSTIMENVDQQSFLALLIQNQSNEYFIDRDGKYFSYILNYFREKKLHLPENFNDWKQFLAETRFYQIDRLSNEIENRLNQKNEENFQIKLISNFNENQRLLKIIAPLKLITLFPIQSIGHRFLKIISSFNHPQNILCQFTFPLDEKLISCQPFDPLQCLVLAKQAKKMGLIVSYSEDYFYIPIEQEIINREDFSQLLLDKYSGKRLNSNIIFNETYNLVEHWLLSTQSDDTYSNASITSVH